VVSLLCHYSNTVSARFTMICARDGLKIVKMHFPWLCYLFTCMLTTYDRSVAVSLSFNAI
jgi:hypothetical protein